MAKCHNRTIPVYFNRMVHKVLFRDQKEKPVVKHAANKSIKVIQNEIYSRGFSQIEGVIYDETLDPMNKIHFHP
jgi:hypothetical protein